MRALIPLSAITASKIEFSLAARDVQRSPNRPGESARRVMTTHPTSVDADSVDDDYGVGEADHISDLRSELIR